MTDSNKAGLQDVIRNHWPSLHVLVVGDVMLDKYIWGEVERISPEAPIPVVRALSQTEQPGGAANVAMNAAALGAQVSLAGFVGYDADGDLLASRLHSASIRNCLTTVEGRPTSTKTRILGGRQQMLRVDVESKSLVPAEAYQKMLRSVFAVLHEGELQKSARVSVVILSDYAKGVLSLDVCQTVIARARELGIPVVVDPKGRGYQRYNGATTVCPNLSELALETNTSGSDEEMVLRAGEAMIGILDRTSFTVTLSERGIVVLDGRTRQHAPALARQVFDVSGAGDTVTAMIALCIASGIETAAALKLANLAAGLVVAKVGTAPVERQELLAAIGGMDIDRAQQEARQLPSEQVKILDLQTMVSTVAGWRAAGDKVVFANGCFDLLHAGHVKLLESARKQGDRLVVALNSDASVRKLKGCMRPITKEGDRATMLAALHAVDGVVLFEDETPLRCVMALRPDVLVKGGDYAGEMIVGSAEVQSWGGVVVIVPIHGNRSTTLMISDLMASGEGSVSLQPEA